MPSPSVSEAKPACRRRHVVVDMVAAFSRSRRGGDEIENRPRGGRGDRAARLILGSPGNDALEDAIDSLDGGPGDDLYLVAAATDLDAGDHIYDSGGGVDMLRFASLTDGDGIVLTTLMIGLDKVEIGRRTGFPSPGR